MRHQLVDKQDSQKISSRITSCLDCLQSTWTKPDPLFVRLSKTWAHPSYASHLRHDKRPIRQVFCEVFQLLHEEGDLSILYDNSPSHRESPNLQYDLHHQRPLPKYSRFLNITENAISTLKNSVNGSLTDAAIQQELNSHTTAAEQGRNLHQHRLVILSPVIESEPPVLTQTKCQD